MTTKEKEQNTPADATADHLRTLSRLTGWARSNYLSNVSRAEGQAAADRLNAADLARSKGTA